MVHFVHEVTYKKFPLLSRFNGKIPAIDLIHDTHHLCTRLRTDGAKAKSRSFSGGKQVIKFANTKNRGRVCSIQNNMKNFFFLEDAKGKLLVKMFIVTLSGSNSDRRCAFSM